MEDNKLLINKEVILTICNMKCIMMDMGDNMEMSWTIIKVILKVSKQDNIFNKEIRKIILSKEHNRYQILLKI